MFAKMDNDADKAFQVLQTLYEEVWTMKDWLRSVGADDLGNPLIRMEDSDSFRQFLATTAVAFAVGTKPPPKFQCDVDCSHQGELLLKAIRRIKNQGRANRNVLTLGFRMISDDQTSRIGLLPDVEYQYPNSNYSQLQRPVWTKLLTRVGDAVMIYLLENAAVFELVPPSSYTQVTGFPAHDLPCFDSGQHDVFLSPINTTPSPLTTVPPAGHPTTYPLSQNVSWKAGVQCRLSKKRRLSEDCALPSAVRKRPLVNASLKIKSNITDMVFTKADGHASCKRSQTGGQASCSRLQISGRASCQHGQRLQMDGHASCQRLPTDGHASCQRLQTDGHASCQRLQTDGHASCQRLQTDGHASCQRLQTEVKRVHYTEEDSAEHDTPVMEGSEGCQTARRPGKTRRGKRKHPAVQPQTEGLYNNKRSLHKTLSWTQALYGKDLREIWPKYHCMSSNHGLDIPSQATKVFLSMFADFTPADQSVQVEKHFKTTTVCKASTGETIQKTSQRASYHPDDIHKGHGKYSTKPLTKVPGLSGEPCGSPRRDDASEPTGETTAGCDFLKVVNHKVRPHLESIIQKHRCCPFRPLLNQFCPISKLDSGYRGHRRGKNAVLTAVEQTRQVSPSHPPPSQARSNLRKKSVWMSVLLGDHIHPRQVFLFLRQICLRVLPRDFLGGQHNWNRLVKNIGAMLSLGRYDKLTVQQLLYKVKVKSVKWLSDCQPAFRVSLMAACLWWLFNNYLMAILKTYFYITDTTCFRNKLFFYRKPVWHQLSSRAKRVYLSKGIFTAVRRRQVDHLVEGGQSLGVCALRFLPKSTSLRPIVNMGRRGGTSQCKPYQDLSVNTQLSDVFQVLKFEKARDPSLVGMSVFGVDDIYTRWRAFIKSRQTKQDARRLYFVSVDVKDCYDSINQQTLFSIASDILKQADEEEYIIRKYVKVVPAAGKLKRLFCCDVTGLLDFEPNFHQYLRAVSKGGNCYKAVVVDQVLHRHITPEEVLQKLSAHLFNNFIQMGPNYYLQKRGISQGSVLSSILCSIYYSRMESRVVPPGLEEEVLMRMVDDWLYVTPQRDRALAFLHAMSNGIADYNCFINPEKTVTNFDVQEDFGHAQRISRIGNEELFPWCGLLLDTHNLSVMVDYSRYPGLSIADTLTFDPSRNPGLTLRRKMLDSLRTRCQGLFVDQQINPAAVVVSNVYRVFLLLAFKFHSLVKRLPPNHRANDNPAFFLGLIQELPHFFSHQTTLKMKKVDPEALLCLRSTSVNWLCCEAFHSKLCHHQSEYYHLLANLNKEQRTLRSDLSLEERQTVCEDLGSRFPSEFQAIHN